MMYYLHVALKGNLYWFRFDYELQAGCLAEDATSAEAFEINNAVKWRHWILKTFRGSSVLMVEANSRRIIPPHIYKLMNIK